MILSTQRYNKCKKTEQDADDSSCSHRQANCRMNDCRANPNALSVAAALRAAFNARVFRTEIRFAQRSGYSLTVRKRSALAITETELKLIAAPAIIGLRRMPNNG